MRRKSRPKQLIDGAGHVDPRVLQSLRERIAIERPEVAFLDASTHSSDPLAEHMGEAVIEAITSGQDDELESRDRITPEELGGPFVETGNETEMAESDTAPNIPDAEPSPFPTT